MNLFPHDNVRDKQEDLIKEVENTIEKEENILVHAPTGIGKTAATITPGIEDAVKNNSKIIFVTPRHSQHQIAIETVKKINEKHGRSFKTADLIGKTHLCEAGQAISINKKNCPRHNKTFDEEGKLSDLTRKRAKELSKKNLTAEQVKKFCTEVCPYQVTLEMLKHSDVIIGDYFHIFHPGIRETMLQRANTTLEKNIIIVDEAHNLPSRTRSLFTHTLSNNLIKKAQIEAEKYGYLQEQEMLERLDNKFSRLAREKLSIENNEKELNRKDLIEPIESIRDYDKFIEDLDAIAQEVMEEEEDSENLEVLEFLDNWKKEGDGFLRHMKKEKGHSGQPFIQIKHSCLNPQISTKEPLNKSKSSILMSGTLKPLEMYEELLGVENANKNEFSSPFPEENELNMIVPRLTTKYKERNEEMYQKYAWYITKSLKAVDGNAAIFFPSYNVMKQITPLLEQKSERKIYIERQDMSKDEKQNLLTKFENDSKEGNSVLAGVTAGSFGEGIDYPGEILKAVIIVGIPLQTPNLETKKLIEYYDKKFGKGWDYAYNYPAMNKAMQAAGRCIRSKTDKGAIIYMDKRYQWDNYKKILPNSKKVKTTKAPWKELERFFNQ